MQEEYWACMLAGSPHIEHLDGAGCGESTHMLDTGTDRMGMIMAKLWLATRDLGLVTPQVEMHKGLETRKRDSLSDDSCRRCGPRESCQTEYLRALNLRLHKLVRILARGRGTIGTWSSRRPSPQVPSVEGWGALMKPE